MVSLLPFLPVYMSYVGLNPVQIGVVTGIEPFIGMFSSPLCGSLADKFSMHRFIMVSSIIGTGLVYGSGVFVSLIDTNNAMNWTNISHVPLEGYLGNIPEPELDSSLIQIWKSDYCDCYHHSISSNIKDKVLYVIKKDMDTGSVETNLSIFKNNCSVACCFCSCRLKDERFIEPLHICNKLERIQRIGRTENESTDILISNEFLCQNIETTDILEWDWEYSQKKDKTLTFVVMLVIVLVGQFASNPPMPLLDAAAMALVKKCNDRGQNVEFGRQRLWSAIALGTFAPLAGFAVDTYSAAYPESFNKYLPAFLAFVALVLLSVIPALCITFPPHCPSESLASDVCILLQRPKVLVFLYAMFITGISVGVISTYVFLFLVELSGSHTIMGLTLTLTCVAQFPFMYFSTKLIGRLGHRGVFVLTLFCYAVRLVGYSFLQNPWLVLPIEFLHGVTYGALWPACTSYVNLITPDNMLTTMQSITFGIKSGLGEGLGTLLGGVIYYQYGARNLFRGTAVLCVVTLIFYWPASAYLERRDERRERQVQYEEI
nr:major facilitator superfamily domain-containing protein 6-like [Lytechinus pictus]